MKTKEASRSKSTSSALADTDGSSTREPAGTAGVGTIKVLIGSCAENLFAQTNYSRLLVFLRLSFDLPKTNMTFIQIQIGPAMSAKRRI